jgi:hypothetical protein
MKGARQLVPEPTCLDKVSESNELQIPCCCLRQPQLLRNTMTCQSLACVSSLYQLLYTSQLLLASMHLCASRSPTAVHYNLKSAWVSCPGLLLWAACRQRLAPYASSPCRRPWRLCLLPCPFQTRAHCGKPSCARPPAEHKDARRLRRGGGGYRQHRAHHIDSRPTVRLAGFSFPHVTPGRCSHHSTTSHRVIGRACHSHFATCSLTEGDTTPPGLTHAGCTW